MQNKSQDYRDVFEKSNIINNKANSSIMSSAKKAENRLKSLSKIHQWHDGLKSNSGYQRMQTMADIAATIIAGGSGG